MYFKVQLYGLIRQIILSLHDTQEGRHLPHQAHAAVLVGCAAHVAHREQSLAAGQQNVRRL